MTAAGNRPAWPGLPGHKTTPDLGPLYAWVEQRLDLDPKEVAAAEAEYSAPHELLKASERSALIESFDRTDEDRWQPLLTILRSGKASPGMMSVVADLIEYNGFAPNSDLGSGSHDASYLYHEYRLVERVLQSGYPEQFENPLFRMATLVTARLLCREEKDVRRVVKRRKAKGRGRPGDVRWRVVTDPATPD